MNNFQIVKLEQLLLHIPHKAVIIRFTLFFLPICILVTGLFLTMEIQQFNTSRQLQLKEEEKRLDFSQDILIRDLQILISDLFLLTHSDFMQRFLNRTNDFQKQDIQHIEQRLLNFSQDRPNYDQIRLLNTKGDEVIRINYNSNNGGHPTTSAAKVLQNKADRYYFKETMALKKGELFLSPLDLNI